MSLGRPGVFRRDPEPRVFVGSWLVPYSQIHTGNAGSYGDPGVWRRKPRPQTFPPKLDARLFATVSNPAQGGAGSYGDPGIWRKKPRPQTFPPKLDARLFAALPTANQGGAGSYGDPGIWRRKPRPQVFNGTSAVLLPAVLPPPAAPDIMSVWKVGAWSARQGVFRRPPYLQVFTGVAQNFVPPVADTTPLFSGRDLRQPYVPKAHFTLPQTDWAAVITPYDTPLSYGPVEYIWKDPNSREFFWQPNQLALQTLLLNAPGIRHALVPSGGIIMTGTGVFSHAHRFSPSGGIIMGGSGDIVHSDTNSRRIWHILRFKRFKTPWG